MSSEMTMEDIQVSRELCLRASHIVTIGWVTIVISDTLLANNITIIMLELLCKLKDKVLILCSSARKLLYWTLV